MKPGTMTDFRLEDCYTFDERVAFIRSTNGELNGDAYKMSSLERFYDDEEFLCISSSGYMDLYVRNKTELNRWRRDTSRSGFRSKCSNVIYCSKLRRTNQPNKMLHIFATINGNKIGSNGENDLRSIALLWNLRRDGITVAYSKLDSLRGAKQVCAI